MVGVIRDGVKGRGMARPQAKLWWGERGWNAKRAEGFP